jgi:hypothetical protein
MSASVRSPWYRSRSTSRCRSVNMPARSSNDRLERPPGARCRGLRGDHELRLAWATQRRTSGAASRVRLLDCEREAAPVSGLAREDIPLTHENGGPHAQPSAGSRASTRGSGRIVLRSSVMDSIRMRQRNNRRAGRGVLATQPPSLRWAHTEAPRATPADPRPGPAGRTESPDPAGTQEPADVRADLRSRRPRR